ncbi:nitrite reductase small subunit NirD [Pelagicoccus sp. SDUM812005]|uniref:nitrite reductase small subunit NirD n=1 Tax=Pelagicoccus sp. SDUM812005 TaxID=3041257 RepID=UPI00280C8AF6|nr:nitrite reductase small subunit NirD [Pelagicoccus sp. SDUM812005]MDQ8183272.1 nitrite reductase small subunit NirD [Pelagicoccus sp. SDUM812005]
MSDNISSNLWTVIGKPDEFNSDLGVCIKIDDEQIAVFKLSGEKEWYATQNLCPHDKRMVLSRGLTGDLNGEPKITCPLHKRSFSLNTGECLTDKETACLKTYPIKEEDGKLLIQFS